MAWGRKNTRKNTGKPDAIGFKGKFLIDAHKRDTEYLANIEALHTFKHRYDRVVHPVDAITPDAIEHECEEYHMDLPPAWAQLKGRHGAPGDKITVDPTPPARTTDDLRTNLESTSGH